MGGVFFAKRKVNVKRESEPLNGLGWLYMNMKKRVLALSQCEERIDLMRPSVIKGEIRFPETMVYSKYCWLYMVVCPTLNQTLQMGLLDCLNSNFILMALSVEHSHSNRTRFLLVRKK